MNRPLEFYGYNTDRRHNWPEIFADQQCPFLNSKCIKQRKSEPQQTIGACMVGYQEKPLIICPKRFTESHQIFVDAIGILTARKARFFIVPEVTMPGGSVDYFIVAVRENEVIDYLGLEIQSLDTTGTGEIWKARQDLGNDELKQRYKYGINWKMSAKTILMQMHHKAESFEILGKKLVLVIQQQFFDYMSREFQTGHFETGKKEDSVYFHIYDCVELNGKLRLRLAGVKSTDVLGIERMLKLGKSLNISEAEVIERIKAKLPSAIQLQV